MAPPPAPSSNAADNSANAAASLPPSPRATNSPHPHHRQSISASSSTLQRSRGPHDVHYAMSPVLSDAAAAHVAAPPPPHNSLLHHQHQMISSASSSPRRSPQQMPPSSSAYPALAPLVTASFAPAVMPLPPSPSKRHHAKSNPRLSVCSTPTGSNSGSYSPSCSSSPPPPPPPLMLQTPHSAAAPPSEDATDAPNLLSASANGRSRPSFSSAQGPAANKDNFCSKSTNQLLLLHGAGGGGGGGGGGLQVNHLPLQAHHRQSLSVSVNQASGQRMKDPLSATPGSPFTIGSPMPFASPSSPSIAAGGGGYNFGYYPQSSPFQGTSSSSSAGGSSNSRGNGAGFAAAANSGGGNACANGRSGSFSAPSGHSAWASRKSSTKCCFLFHFPTSILLIVLLYLCNDIWFAYHSITEAAEAKSVIDSWNHASNLAASLGKAPINPAFSLATSSISSGGSAAILNDPTSSSQPSPLSASQNAPDSGADANYSSSYKSPMDSMDGFSDFISKVSDLRYLMTVNFVVAVVDILLCLLGLAGIDSESMRLFTVFTVWKTLHLCFSLASSITSLIIRSYFSGSSRSGAAAFLSPDSSFRRVWTIESTWFFAYVFMQLYFLMFLYLYLIYLRRIKKSRR